MLRQERPWSMTVDGIPIEVTRKSIRHFHLKVHRRDGRVRVSAPRGMTAAMIRDAVLSRLDWIRRQLERLEGVRREPPPAYVTGERHCFQGRARTLHVLEEPARPRVRPVGDGVIELRVRPGSDPSRRRAVLEDWYRAFLRETLPGLVRLWEPVMGVEVAEWRIKRMKTRWGSCNPVARRIWLNLELAKKPPECLEYVVVHEMVHLLERSHNARFHGYMDHFLPAWRAYRQCLHEAS